MVSKSVSKIGTDLKHVKEFEAEVQARGSIRMKGDPRNVISEEDRIQSDHIRALAILPQPHVRFLGSLIVGGIRQDYTNEYSWSARASWVSKFTRERRALTRHSSD